MWRVVGHPCAYIFRNSVCRAVSHNESEFYSTFLLASCRPFRTRLHCLTDYHRIQILANLPGSARILPAKQVSMNQVWRVSRETEIRSEGPESPARSTPYCAR